MNYGRVRTNPQLYQDDWLRVANTVNAARVGMMKLLCMIREKQLTCHKEKTCFVVIGARARGAIREVKSVMEDFSMQAIGGMAGAWDLWKAGICASLLANSGMWVKLNKEEVKKLNDLFHKLFRNIHSCPPSTPLPALRSQAGMVLTGRRSAWWVSCCTEPSLATTPGRCLRSRS